MKSNNITAIKDKLSKKFGNNINAYNMLCRFSLKGLSDLEEKHAVMSLFKEEMHNEIHSLEELRSLAGLSHVNYYGSTLPIPAKIKDLFKTHATHTMTESMLADVYYLGMKDMLENEDGNENDAQPAELGLVFSLHNRDNMILAVDALLNDGIRVDLSMNMGQYFFTFATQELADEAKNIVNNVVDETKEQE